MKCSEWGMTADEVRAVIADAGGIVLAKFHKGSGRNLNQVKLVGTTNRNALFKVAGEVRTISLDDVKPSAGKSRSIVEAMRAKRDNPTPKPPAIVSPPKAIPQPVPVPVPQPQEAIMPPDFAPRPQTKATSVPVPSTATLSPGTITMAASKIETALREVESRKSDVAAAERDMRAAEDLLSSARSALAKAEGDARKLAADFNALVSGVTG
jgi:hypothetical protein